MIVLFIICISMVLVSNQEVFYIKPSSSDACLEGAQCLTLSQFISQNGYINKLKNVTLCFQSGNHILSSVLIFTENVVAMVNTCSESDRSYRCIIRCIDNGTVGFIYTRLASIYNVEFKNCPVQLVENVNVNIVNSSFFFGFRGEFHKTYLGYFLGYGKPGVIFSQRSNITLSGCTFENNEAELGAALFVTESVVEIYNSSFMDNRVVCTRRSKRCLGAVLYSYKSTITIEYSNFQNNSAEHLRSQGGGVFALDESSASIHYSHFTANIATHGSGGVIYGWKTNISIIASSFINNKAAQFGGVIQLKGGRVTDDNSHYEGNAADSEGGVVFLEQGMLTFIQSKLLFNSAQSIGGAIREHMGTLSFNECDISGNSAETSGGAVSINQVHLTLNRSNFTKNIITAVEGYGGAINAIESYNISIWTSIFSSNKGAYGGVLYVESQSQRYSMLSLKFSVSDASFISNSAAKGIVYIRYSESIIIDNCIFTNNSASVGTGGVIFSFEGETMLIESCMFSYNSASVVGGVIHIFYSETTIIGNCTFTNNSASLGEAGVIHSYIGETIQLQWVELSTLHMRQY